MSNDVVHICTRQAWERACQEGVYRPESLTQEGFIHLSRPEQVLATANRFFAGQQGLVLLWIAPEKLAAPLKWEAADGEVFPHLYGALPATAVTAVTDFPPNAAGKFETFTRPAGE
ncbi:MAG: DUF952 domain-containing protein [Anaerolineales bacterium]